MNWQTCTCPRKFGGLEIKDLEKFNRALRLRWLWNNWAVIDIPWKFILRHRDYGERTLFFAST